MKKFLFILLLHSTLFFNANSMTNSEQENIDELTFLVHMCYNHNMSMKNALSIISRESEETQKQIKAQLSKNPYNLTKYNFQDNEDQLEIN